MSAALGVLVGVMPARAASLPLGYGTGAGYCSLYGNYASSLSYDDVYACATVESQGPTPFDADKDESFQCVELSARFLWAIYGIWAGPGSGVRDGADLVGAVHRRYPEIRVGTPAPGTVPVAGDVLSLGPGGAVDASFGHTAIVISDDQRHGRFRILSQNLPAGEAGMQTLSVDLSGHHNGRAWLNGVWTKASWLELRRAPKPERPPPHRRHLG